MTHRHRKEAWLHSDLEKSIGERLPILDSDSDNDDDDDDGDDDGETTFSYNNLISFSNVSTKRVVSKVHSNKNKVPLRLENKPKRPLSAYNIFFQLSRNRILNNDAECGYTMEEINHICVQRTLPKKKRRHRKTHGKISFGDLARAIADKWKNLDTDLKQMFINQAEKEKARYLKDVINWKKESMSAMKSMKKCRKVSLEPNSCLSPDLKPSSSNDQTPSSSSNDQTAIRVASQTGLNNGESFVVSPQETFSSSYDARSSTLRLGTNMAERPQPFYHNYFDTDTNYLLNGNLNISNTHDFAAIEQQQLLLLQRQRQQQQLQRELQLELELEQEQLRLQQDLQQKLHQQELLSYTSGAATLRMINQVVDDGLHASNHLVPVDDLYYNELVSQQPLLQTRMPGSSVYTSSLDYFPSHRQSLDGSTNANISFSTLNDNSLSPLKYYDSHPNNTSGSNVDPLVYPLQLVSRQEFPDVSYNPDVFAASINKLNGTNNFEWA